MESDRAAKVVQQLTLGNIPSCLVGELALNYYNVPRAVHVRIRSYILKQVPYAKHSQEIEICVPTAHFSEALEILQNKCQLLKISDDVKADLFTDYKQNFPRFAFQQGSNMKLTLLRDEVYGFQCFKDAIVPKDDHHPDSYYSKDILDALSPDVILSLPFPSLGPLMGGSCTKYIQTRDIVYAMAAEQLVDGMDIDLAWCQKHLTHLSSDEQQFAHDLVEGKRDRMDEFSGNEITCYVANSQHVSDLRRIPGSGFSELYGSENTQRLM